MAPTAARPSRASRTGTASPGKTSPDHSPDLWLTAIDSDGHGGLWVSGTDRTDPVTAAPVFWHYDGTTWTKMPGASAPDGDNQSPRYAFYDLEPIGSTGAYWAVGDYSLPMTAESETPINGLIERSTPHSPTPTRR